MSSYFRDFVEPVRLIFDRLDKQKNPGVQINNGGASGGGSVTPPYYPVLPDYPCKIIRGADGKVSELHYGKDNTEKGYIWRHIICRGDDGKVAYIKQENPDGTFNITFHRDDNKKVDLISIE